MVMDSLEKNKFVIQQAAAAMIVWLGELAVAIERTKDMPISFVSQKLVVDIAWSDVSATYRANLLQAH